MKITRKESLSHLLLNIEVTKKTDLPFYENFLKWLDCSKGSSRCNLQNYINFLKSVHHTWWVCRDLKFESFVDFVEDLYPTQDK